MNRLEEVPRMKWGEAEIPAALYNQVRLSLLRTRTPQKVLRFPAGLRDLEMIVEANCWYCVDTSMNDLPVFAWDHFQHHRDALHTPIPCRLSIYHAHAERILEAVQAEMMRYLQAYIAARR